MRALDTTLLCRQARASSPATSSAAAAAVAALAVLPKILSKDALRFHEKLAQYLGRDIKLPRLLPDAPPVDLKALWQVGCVHGLL
jgi:hypothetical protein